MTSQPAGKPVRMARTPMEPLQSRGGQRIPAFDPQRYVRSDLPQQLIEEVKSIFDYVDLNSSGGIDPKEMKQALLEIGVDNRHTAIQEIFWRLDNNHNKLIDFNEFLDMMTQTMFLGHDVTNIKNYFITKMMQGGGSLPQRNPQPLVHQEGPGPETGYIGDHGPSISHQHSQSMSPNQIIKQEKDLRAGIISSRDIVIRPQRRMFAGNPAMISHLPLPGGQEPVTKSPTQISKRFEKRLQQQKDHFVVASGLEVTNNEANPVGRGPGLLRPPPSRVGSTIQNLVPHPPQKIPLRPLQSSRNSSGIFNPYDAMGKQVLTAQDQYLRSMMSRDGNAQQQSGGGGGAQQQQQVAYQNGGMQNSGGYSRVAGAQYVQRPQEQVDSMQNQQPPQPQQEIVPRSRLQSRYGSSAQLGVINSQPLLTASYQSLQLQPPPPVQQQTMPSGRPDFQNMNYEEAVNQLPSLESQPLPTQQQPLSMQHEYQQPPQDSAAIPNPILQTGPEQYLQQQHIPQTNGGINNSHVPSFMRGFQTLQQPGDTIDRNRYMAKITLASNKQLENFKRAQELKEQAGLGPKEKLLLRYMNGGNPGSLFDQNMMTPPKNIPLGKVQTQLELCDPEARAGLQRILEVQMREKRDRRLQEIQQNQMMHQRVQLEADLHRKEQTLHEVARKELQQDYRNFLDQQKWGNATLKEQLAVDLQGNPHPRRNGAHAMLPPKPTMPLHQGQLPTLYQMYGQQQPMHPYNNNGFQQPPNQQAPPYGVDVPPQLMPVSRNINQMSLRGSVNLPPNVAMSLQQPGGLARSFNFANGGEPGMVRQNSQAQQLYVSSIAARNMQLGAYPQPQQLLPQQN